MTHNYFEEYKKAVKSKYDVEKNGTYSSFLLSPSRANLRNLCAERFKGNTSADDLSTYRIFFGFDYEEGNKYKLQSETGKFRAIENFFKETNDTNEMEGINLAAILVDFKPRPFRKFASHDTKLKENEQERFYDRKDADPSTTEPAVASNWRKKILVAVLLLLGISTVGYTAMNLIAPEKQCMQWQKDHYEPIDCQSEINSLYTSAPIVPFDEEINELKKLEVCKTTCFFKGGKASIWYCKVDNQPEFFDGPGFHPITGKALRPITQYIIDKYVAEK